MVVEILNFFAIAWRGGTIFPLDALQCLKADPLECLRSLPDRDVYCTVISNCNYQGVYPSLLRLVWYDGLLCFFYWAVLLYWTFYVGRSGRDSSLWFWSLCSFSSMLPCFGSHFGLFFSFYAQVFSRSLSCCRGFFHSTYNSSTYLSPNSGRRIRTAIPG